MTDCLSEDDDEEHHPVHLLNRIAVPWTCGANEKRSRSNPEYAHLRDVRNPLSQSDQDDSTAISPVFQDRCSYGLMGI